MTPGSGFAQTQDATKPPAPQKFYKLEFVVKEVEGGKVLNARTYSTMAIADVIGHPQIRAGGKVPYTLDSKTSPSFQYVDIGVNIDCNSIREVERGLTMNVIASITSMPSDPAAPTAALMTAPSIRSYTWGSVVILPLKKPTLIFSSDDPASKRQMQLELTATPIQ
jgi:hypothetical protein